MFIAYDLQLDQTHSQREPGARDRAKTDCARRFHKYSAPNGASLYSVAV